MDSFKGVFVSAFATFIVIGACFSIYQYSNDLSNLAWLGNLLSFGTGAVYFGGIYLISTPRTSKNMWSTWVPLILGTVLVSFVTLTTMDVFFPFVFNLMMLLGWFLYTYWATDFSTRDKSTLVVGKPFPNVSLKDVDGKDVTIDSFKGAPAIFLFYRGNWCPFCMAQIKELSKEYQTIKEQGAALVFVSPQSPRHTKSLAKKFDIPAQFLIDTDLKAATKLKLFHQKGTPRGMEALGYDTDNVLPTLIIIDAKGIIRFADLTDNYRIRPEPSLYLELLQTLN